MEEYQDGNHEREKDINKSGGGDDGLKEVHLN